MTDLTDVKRNLSRMNHCQIYHRNDLPSRYHYKHSSHVGDLILLVQAGYEIHRRSSRMFLGYFIRSFFVSIWK